MMSTKDDPEKDNLTMFDAIGRVNAAIAARNAALDRADADRGALVDLVKAERTAYAAALALPCRTHADAYAIITHVRDQLPDLDHDLKNKLLTLAATWLQHKAAT